MIYDVYLYIVTIIVASDILEFIYLYIYIYIYIYCYCCYFYLVEYFHPIQVLR